MNYTDSYCGETGDHITVNYTDSYFDETGDQILMMLMV